MKKILHSDIVTTSLAIFSMLFGAGNLLYPLLVGINAADKNNIGIFSFILTAVILPAIGFICMILFDGNYTTFFYRLGRPIGKILIAICMCIIGPLIAIPRITTLSHTMMAPFIPWQFLQTINPCTSFIFACIFLSITFLMTYQESKIVDILGKIISPLLLISLSIIIIKGLCYGPHTIIPTSLTKVDVFIRNFMRGYETLDLLGGIFFSSIVLSILRGTLQKNIANNPKILALIGIKASIIGTSLLALIYIGMSKLGVYYSTGLESVNGGELFREISFRILGSYGMIIIAIAVLMACFSTAITLAAIVTEYVQNEILNNKIGYIPTLILILILCIPLSTFGLTRVLSLTGGAITFIGYPVLITLTFCNMAYKLFNFKPVKIPVAVTFLLALFSYIR